MSTDPPPDAEAPAGAAPTESPEGSPFEEGSVESSAEGSAANPEGGSAGADEKVSPDDEEVSLADGWAALRSWPWTRQLSFVLATSFVLYHIGAVLLRGAPKKWREPLWPLASWYAEDLRMTDTWGMFSLPPKDKLVSVIGITQSGERVEISHVQQNERDFAQRVVDIRLRKIQTKLADEKSRNHWGWGYVKYFCQDALARGVPLTRIQLEVQTDDEKAPDVYLKQACRPKPQSSGGPR